MLSSNLDTSFSSTILLFGRGRDRLAALQRRILFPRIFGNRRARSQTSRLGITSDWHVIWVTWCSVERIFGNTGAVFLFGYVDTNRSNKFLGSSLCDDGALFVLDAIVVVFVLLGMALLEVSGNFLDILLARLWSNRRRRRLTACLAADVDWVISAGLAGEEGVAADDELAARDVRVLGSGLGHDGGGGGGGETGGACAGGVGGRYVRG